ncbi:MAG: hypothetical protein ACLUIQ_03485 [Dialister invisus]
MTAMWTESKGTGILANGRLNRRGQRRRHRFHRTMMMQRTMHWRRKAEK